MPANKRFHFLHACLTFQMGFQQVPDGAKPKFMWYGPGNSYITTRSTISDPNFHLSTRGHGSVIRHDSGNVKRKGMWFYALRSAFNYVPDDFDPCSFSFLRLPRDIGQNFLRLDVSGKGAHEYGDQGWFLHWTTLDYNEVPSKSLWWETSAARSQIPLQTSPHLPSLDPQALFLVPCDLNLPRRKTCT